MKQKTIYFVWNYLSWGGAQMYFLAVMKRAREKYKIRVILPEGYSRDFLNYLDDLAIEYEFFSPALIEIPVKGWFKKIRRQWIRIRSELHVYQNLTRHELNGNIIHIEAAPWQSWILLTFLAIRGASLFVTLHSRIGEPSLPRRIVWLARLQYVTRFLPLQIITSNLDTRDSLRPYLPAKYLASIPITYTSIDPFQIQIVKDAGVNKTNLRKRFSVPDSTFVVLTVGNFIDRKGRWPLLDAVRLVTKQTMDVRFLWLAPEHPNDCDQERIDGYDVENAFRIVRSRDVGPTREEILEFFLIADAFVLPSFVEGLPIAILEAMALGLPVVSTTANAIPEAVIEGETGLLVAPGDVNALVDTILRLKEDPNLCSRLGIAASRLVLEKFVEIELANRVISNYRARASR